MENHLERVVFARNDTRADVRTNSRLGVGHAGNSCGFGEFDGRVIITDVGGSKADSTAWSIKNARPWNSAGDCCVLTVEPLLPSFEPANGERS